MKKQPQFHHRFPQTLIAFQNLEGGSYGRLEMVAIHRDQVEIRLGNDFVRVDADGVSHIAEACARFVGGPPPQVIIEEEEEEVEVEEEPEQPKLVRSRRPVRRRSGL